MTMNQQKSVDQAIAALQEKHPAPWRVLPANTGSHGIEDANGWMVALVRDEGTAHRIVDLVNVALSADRYKNWLMAAAAVKQHLQGWLSSHGSDAQTGEMLAMLDGAKLPADGPALVFRGYISIEGVTVGVDFSLPASATDAEKDAAFLAAVSQKAEVAYSPAGVTEEVKRPSQTFVSREPLLVTDQESAQNLITSAGFTIEGSRKAPGKWCWWHMTSATESEPHESQEDAMAEALECVVKHTLEYHDVSIKFWNTLSAKQQQELAREAYIP